MTVPAHRFPDPDLERRIRCPGAELPEHLAGELVKIIACCAACAQEGASVAETIGLGSTVLAWGMDTIDDEG